MRTEFNWFTKANVFPDDEEDLLFYLEYTINAAKRKAEINLLFITRFTF